MAKLIKKIATKTPIKNPLQPPPAQQRVLTKKFAPALPGALSAPIPGSVSPPSQPNISLPPNWLGAFRR
jgi:hypothetical protein